MKPVFIICFVFSALSKMHSQDYAFTVYLNNGSILSHLIIRSAEDDSVVFCITDSGFLINPDSIKTIHLFGKRASDWGLTEGFTDGAIAGGALGMIAVKYGEEPHLTPQIQKII